MAGIRLSRKQTHGLKRRKRRRRSIFGCSELQNQLLYNPYKKMTISGK
jgi:hypothetical protein